MANNSSILTVDGPETFSNKDISGVKHPKHILCDPSGSELSAATGGKQDTGNTLAASILTKLADPATQTSLAAVLAKLSSDPSTATGQAAIITAIAAIATGGTATAANQASQVTLATAFNTALGLKTDAKNPATDATPVTSVSIWKQISASAQAIATSIAGTLTFALPTGASTSANQTTAITSLTNILAKISGDPASQSTLAAVLAKITSDPATQTTLAAILAKQAADPSTSANQTSANLTLASILAKLSSEPATQTSLAAVLAKLSADPSTAANQTSGNTSLASILTKLTADPATQTTLAAILAKLTNDPATQTTLAAILARLTSDPSTAANQAGMLAALAGTLTVKAVGRGVTLTNRSGTVTAGGTAQVLAALNASRTGFAIQNQSTGDLWFSSLGTAAAVQPSFWLSSGAYFEFPETGVPTTAISIFGATTGQAFAAREW